MRALAVIAVVLFHSALGIAPGGFLGVEVFFVISGYIITRALLTERASSAEASPWGASGCAGHAGCCQRSSCCSSP